MSKGHSASWRCATGLALEPHPLPWWGGHPHLPELPSQPCGGCTVHLTSPHIDRAERPTAAMSPAPDHTGHSVGKSKCPWDLIKAQKTHDLRLSLQPLSRGRPPREPLARQGLFLSGDRSSSPIMAPRLVRNSLYEMPTQREEGEGNTSTPGPRWRPAHIHPKPLLCPERTALTPTERPLGPEKSLGPVRTPSQTLPKLMSNSFPLEEDLLLLFLSKCGLRFLTGS